MHFLVYADKVIKPCETSPLKSNFFQIPLTLLHDALSAIVYSVVLKIEIKLFSCSCSCCEISNLFAANLPVSSIAKSGSTAYSDPRMVYLAHDVQDHLKHKQNIV